jgi:uncharacterized membrane protein (UPF0127 family)
MLHTFLNTKNGRATVFVAAFVIALAALFIGRALSTAVSECGKPELLLGDARILLTVAQTPSEQERGLSGHAPLAADEGMLFLFDDVRVKQFWMKDMGFPIDIIWISPEWKVNAWAANALPESYPALFTSPDNTQYVLEVPAGTAKRLWLRTGEAATFLSCGTKKGVKPQFATVPQK